MSYLIHWAFVDVDGNLLNRACQAFICDSPDSSYPSTILPGIFPVRVKVDEIPLEV